MAKDSPRITAGELQRLVESWGQKPKKKIYIYQISPTSPHVVRGGFKKKTPGSAKNNLWHIQLSDTTGTSNNIGFYGQMKLKKSFLAANPPDVFGANRDKKYPMSTIKYTAGSLMLWACFSAGGPEHLVQMHGIMDSIKYQQIKNLNLTASVRNRIMDHVWIFHQDNSPKQTSKSTQKCVTEHKMKLLTWLSLSSDLNPVENE